MGDTTHQQQWQRQQQQRWKKRKIHEWMYSKGESKKSHQENGKCALREMVIHLIDGGIRRTENWSYEKKNAKHWTLRHVRTKNENGKMFRCADSMKIYKTEEETKLEKRSSLRSCGRMITLTLTLLTTVGVFVLFSMGLWILYFISLDKHIFLLVLYMYVLYNDIKRYLRWCDNDGSEINICMSIVECIRSIFQLG